MDTVAKEKESPLRRKRLNIPLIRSYDRNDALNSKSRFSGWGINHMDKNTLPQRSARIPEMTKPWEGRGCKGIAQDAAFYGLTAVAAVGILKTSPIFVPAWAIHSYRQWSSRKLSEQVGRYERGSSYEKTQLLRNRALKSLGGELMEHVDLNHWRD
jgi:hypothetical protein